MHRQHRHLATGICLLFLAYGLVRLVVGTLVLGQVVGVIDVPDFREPVAEMGAFLAGLGDRPLVSAGPAGYMAWLVLMGGVLTAGATLALLRGRGGSVLIGTFLVLWAALFVNVQTVNPKLVHLAVAAGLFGVLLWLQRRKAAASP